MLTDPITGAVRSLVFLVKGSVILLMLFVINWMTSPGHWWVQWAALGIGIAWVLSFFRVRLAPSTTRVVVVPAADILADDRGHETHLEAAGILTAATGGVIQFTLAAVAPPSGVVVTARVDPAHETCTERVRDFASVTLRAGDIVEGTATTRWPGARPSSTSWATPSACATLRTPGT